MTIPIDGLMGRVEAGRATKNFVAVRCGHCVTLGPMSQTSGVNPSLSDGTKKTITHPIRVKKR